MPSESFYLRRAPRGTLLAHTFSRAMHLDFGPHDDLDDPYHAIINTFGTQKEEADRIYSQSEENALKSVPLSKLAVYALMPKFLM